MRIVDGATLARIRTMTRTPTPCPCRGRQARLDRGASWSSPSDPPGCVAAVPPTLPRVRSSWRAARGSRGTAAHVPSSGAPGTRVGLPPRIARGHVMPRATVCIAQERRWRIGHRSAIESAPEVTRRPPLSRIRARMVDTSTFAHAIPRIPCPTTVTTSASAPSSPHPPRTHRRGRPRSPVRGGRIRPRDVPGPPLQLRVPGHVDAHGVRGGRHDPDPHRSQRAQPAPAAAGRAGAGRREPRPAQRRPARAWGSAAVPSGTASRRWAAAD